MKKQNIFTAYLLIGLGIYFLIKQLNLPIFNNFYGWSTIVILIGISLVTYSYSMKDFQYIFPGVIVLGFGIHFHGLANYNFWIEHWSVYPLIVGIAFIIRYLKSKTGLIPGIFLIAFSLFMLYSIKIPGSNTWIYRIIEFIETFWPVVLIVLGISLLRFKK